MWELWFGVRRGLGFQGLKLSRNLGYPGIWDTQGVQVDQRSGVLRGLGCQGSSCPGLWVPRTLGWLPRVLWYPGVWDARDPVAQGFGVSRNLGCQWLKLPKDFGYPGLQDGRISGCPGIWGSCPGTPTSSTLCKLWFWPSFSLRGGPMGREMHPQVPAPRHERGQQWRLRVVLSAALSPALP